MPCCTLRLSPSLSLSPFCALLYLRRRFIHRVARCISLRCHPCRRVTRCVSLRRSRRVMSLCDGAYPFVLPSRSNRSAPSTQFSNCSNESIFQRRPDVSNLCTVPYSRVYINLQYIFYFPDIHCTVSCGARCAFRYVVPLDSTDQSCRYITRNADMSLRWMESIHPRAHITACIIDS